MENASELVQFFISVVDLFWNQKNIHKTNHQAK